MSVPEASVFFTLGVALMFFELLFGALTGLDIFFLGASFIIGGVSGLKNPSLLSMIALTVTVYLIYLLFLRRRVRRTLIVFIQRSNIVDVFTGKEAVIVFFDKKTKRAKVLVDGELWDGVFNKNPRFKKPVYVIAFKNNILELEEDGV
jgi:membrane protein implicated in regulation of membrane protease activity